MRKTSNGAWRGLGPRENTRSSTARIASAAKSVSGGSRSRPPGSVRASVSRSSPRDDHQIDVSIELQVLEAIVEDVHRRAEVMLGEAARQEAIARREDRDARQLPRQHQRLVTGPIEIRADAVGVADDDHAVFGLPAPVAAAQDRGPLAHGEQLARQVRDGGRLASTTDSDVADTDHSAAQPSSQVRPRRIVLAPPPRDGRIKRAQHANFQPWLSRADGFFTMATTASAKGFGESAVALRRRMTRWSRWHDEFRSRVPLPRITRGVPLTTARSADGRRAEPTRTNPDTSKPGFVLVGSTRRRVAWPRVSGTAHGFSSVLSVSSVACFDSNGRTT